MFYFDSQTGTNEKLNRNKRKTRRYFTKKVENIGYKLILLTY